MTKTREQIEADHAAAIKAANEQRDREIAALNEPWRPRSRSLYKCIGAFGEFHELKWRNDEFDLKCLAFGNVYPADTDEAERASARQFALVRLLRLPGARREFRFGQKNWIIYFDEEQIRIDYRESWNCGIPIYFDTKAQADSALASNLADFKLVYGVEG